MSESSSMPDFKSFARYDQLFLGAGFLTFIFSFIAFAHIHLAGFGGDTISAWHGIGTLAALLILAAVIVGFINLTSPSTLSSLPVSGRLLATGLAALALLFFIIRWATLPSASGPGFHIGYSLYWGGYVLLVLNVVTIVEGYLGMRANGESMPGHPSQPTAPSA
ncbi:MAG TPA: hypothetical protein VG650_06570 [Mycobacteriales bacterium]|nr:hypothetical protein [Mycobacteriales bacterium]